MALRYARLGLRGGPASFATPIIRGPGPGAFATPPHSILKSDVLRYARVLSGGAGAPGGGSGCLRLARVAGGAGAGGRAGGWLARWLALGARRGYRQALACRYRTVAGTGGLPLRVWRVNHARDVRDVVRHGLVSNELAGVLIEQRSARPTLVAHNPHCRLLVVTERTAAR